MVFISQGNAPASLGNLKSQINNHKTLSISSTSCSTIVRLYHLYLPPMFLHSALSSDAQTAAALFSLLNDYRLAKGRPPLGFLNPWLYNTGWLGFDDIISGTNPGCNTVGFSAVTGWDPVRPARHLTLRFRLH